MSLSLYAFEMLLPVTVQPGIHPASFVFQDNRKYLTRLQQAIPPPLLFLFSLRLYPTMPSFSKPQDNYGLAHLHLIPKSFLSRLLVLPPFVCFPLPTLLAYDLLLLPSGKCGCMTYCTRAFVCVWGDGHLGSWPSSWILSRLLNSDSLPLPFSLSSAGTDSRVCSGIPMSGRMRGRESRSGGGGCIELKGAGREGDKARGQKAHGKAMQEK